MEMVLAGGGGKGGLEEGVRLLFQDNKNVLEFTEVVHTQHIRTQGLDTLKIFSIFSVCVRVPVGWV